MSSITVTIGGNSATNIQVPNSTTITATTPAHADGPVDVQVSVAGVASNVLSNAFTYAPGGATVQGVYGGVSAQNATGVNWNGTQMTLVPSGDVLTQRQTTTGVFGNMFPFDNADEFYIYLLLSSGSHTFRDGGTDPGFFDFAMATPIAVTVGGVNMYLYRSRYPLLGAYSPTIVS